MSKIISNLFAFNRRDMAKPFDTLTNKSVSGVSSKYSTNTQSTLSPSMIKAVNAYCKCLDGSGAGALGYIDHRTVAEYKSAMGPDAYHIAVYDPTTGNILASVYDTATDIAEVYSLAANGKDGSAILLAILPELLKDDEFKDALDAYIQLGKTGFANRTETVNCMATLCDNAYRRISDDACPAAIKLTLQASGNIARVSPTQIDAGTFKPSTVIAGQFRVLAKSAAQAATAPVQDIAHEDFAGKYALNPNREFSELEQQLIPQLPPWYVIPKEVVEICTHANCTTKKHTPMRNFLMRGPAGTGKTEGAKAVATGLGLPFVQYTCSASTEIFDFIGQVFPAMNDHNPEPHGVSGPQADQSELKESISYQSVARLLQLPGLDDMDYDPAGVFKKLTGTVNKNATTQDCMAIVMDKVTAKVQSLCAAPEADGKPTFTYVETDFIKALKHGYVIEIREPTVIMQPGVLVGLNSLLEQSGNITLPTGEVITRHPDAVVIVTTNVNYEGCRGLNQSVTDRMSMILDIDLPSKEVMAERAMRLTGFDDEYLVLNMVQVVLDIADYCRKNGISDGSYGMRALIDWLISTEITGDPYRSAIATVISKAASDEEDRDALIATVLEPIIPLTKTA